MDSRTPDSRPPPRRSPPPFEEISSEAFDPRTGLEIYRELTEVFYDAQIEVPEPRALSWRVRSRLMGPLILGATEIEGAQASVERSAGKIARASLDVIKIQWFLAGGDQRQFDGRDSTRTRVEAGDICLSDMSRRELTTQGAAKSLCLIIPRHLFESHESDLDPLHGRVLRSGTASHALLSAHMGALWRNAGRISNQEVNAVATATASLVANLLIGQKGESPVLRYERSDDALLARIKRHIRDHLADPTLDAEQLCRQFGLSRASLYRLFEPFGGVAAHIRDQRLKRVYREIMATEPSGAGIGRIAHACGFANLAGFNRAFKHRYGVSPSEARALGDNPWATGASAERPHLALTDWIRELDVG